MWGGSGEHVGSSSERVRWHWDIVQHPVRPDWVQLNPTDRSTRFIQQIDWYFPRMFIDDSSENWTVRLVNSIMDAWDPEASTLHTRYQLAVVCIHVVVSLALFLSFSLSHTHTRTRIRTPHYPFSTEVNSFLPSIESNGRLSNGNIRFGCVVIDTIIITIIGVLLLLLLNEKSYNRIGWKPVFNLSELRLSIHVLMPRKI